MSKTLFPLKQAIHEIFGQGYSKFLPYYLHLIQEMWQNDCYTYFPIIIFCNLHNLYHLYNLYCQPTATLLTSANGISRLDILLEYPPFIVYGIRFRSCVRLLKCGWMFLKQKTFIVRKCWRIETETERGVHCVSAGCHAWGIPE